MRKVQRMYLLVVSQYAANVVQGGVTGKDGKDAKTLLGKLIDHFAKQHPEPMTASENLWKFAKKHDRRCYQLVRFAMAPESDYRKVTRAIVSSLPFWMCAATNPCLERIDETHR